MTYGNGRIDIFDQNGKLLEQWKHWGRPTGLFIDRNDVLYSADSGSSAGQGNTFVRGVHIGSAKTGELKSFIPDALGNPAPWHPLRGTSSPEGVAVDVDGRIYIAGVTPPGMGRYRELEIAHESPVRSASLGCIKVPSGRPTREFRLERMAFRG